MASSPAATFRVAALQQTWRGMALSGRSASQSHCNDRRHMLGVPTATDAVEVTSDVERHSFGQAVAYLGYRGWEAFHVDVQRPTWFFKRRAKE